MESTQATPRAPDVPLTPRANGGDSSGSALGSSLVLSSAVINIGGRGDIWIEWDSGGQFEMEPREREPVGNVEET